MTNGAVVCDAVVAALERRVAAAQAQGAEDAVTCFHSVSIPGISVRDYVQRVRQFSHASDECYVLACIFLDRLAQKEADYSVDRYSVHKLFVTAFLIAAKAQDDRVHNNKYYSVIAGTSLECLKHMEREFLTGIQFDLYVHPAEFEFYEEALCGGDLGDGTAIVSRPFEHKAAAFRNASKSWGDLDAASLASASSS
eukprot:TRINITY_DN27404_c0_g1_i1.p1 TRINITY_DN27404_c0_g1~~TRINITY_DN27404_c0_g1_i1.p1  ORF type:complete len:196 (+),score=84.25 TRINITY_DN27404_c0_g1_i1:130-717(+)